MQSSTHKNGTHLIFSKNSQIYKRDDTVSKRTAQDTGGEHTRLPCPIRYCKSVKPTLPEPMKTTVVASQISKLCM